MRQFQPPGPPPPPPTGSGSPYPEETARLYLYGRLDIGNVDVGDYIGRISIEVRYQ